MTLISDCSAVGVKSIVLVLLHIRSVHYISICYTPVAFWVLNDDPQYKYGDTVNFHEVDVAVTPKIVAECKQTPKTKLVELKDKMKDFLKNHF